MAGSNPWFKNARVPIESLTPDEEGPAQGTLLMDERETRHVIIVDEPKPTAWQRMMGVMFGEGVALVPVTAATDKPMTKRRMRRLRGKLKEARR